MSRHTDSDGTTCYAADRAWTGALYVYAVRCDGCGDVISAGPRDTPERAENATRHHAVNREGWRLVNAGDACPTCRAAEGAR